MTLVAESVTSAVTQHMGPDATEPGARTGFADEIVHRLARHRLTTLGDEQPGQFVVARGEVAFDGAELIALDRLLSVERVL